MSPVLVHYCDFCSYNTPVPYTASAFHTTHPCAHCGKPSAGVDTQDRSRPVMSNPQQDELSHLFARNMNFSQSLPQFPVTPDKQFISQPPAANMPVYASQHYTHSAYLRPSEPPIRADTPLDLSGNDIESTLRQHDIDPTSLFPSQIKLYAGADYEQRLRLLELWRISPPDYGSRGLAEQSRGAWPETSVTQEEDMAKLRYERRMRERKQQDVRNDSSQITNDVHQSGFHEAEPYVASGYAELRHLDPVYAAATGLWQAPNYSQAVQTMEDRYGAFQQACLEQFQGSSRETKSQNFHHGSYGSLDDDMVM